MERLTAIFLQALSDNTAAGPQLAQRTSRELAAGQERRMGAELAPDTLYFSAEGRALQAEAQRWRARAQGIARPQEGVRLLKELDDQTARAARLHAETRAQIGSPGRIDPAKLHYFYRAEQNAALDTLESYLKVALYRILVLGGAERFARLLPLADFPHTLAGRMRYFKEQVAPAEQTLDGAARLWAVQQREETRVGPLARLPGFVRCDPVATGAPLLPGEHTVLTRGGATIYQGVGIFTNLTPETVAEAQGQALGHTLTARALMPALNRLHDPDAALQICFGGKPYAVDPADYFAVADFARGAAVLQRRGGLGQCFFCGAPAEQNEPLCPACQKRVRIR